MTFSRTSSGLVIRDTFSADTSGNYYASDSKTLSVDAGQLGASGQCVFEDIDVTPNCVTVRTYRVANQSSSKVGLYTTTNPTVANRQGLEIVYSNSSSMFYLVKDRGTALDSDATDKPAAGDNVYLSYRLFRGASGVLGWAGRTYPLTCLLTSSNTDFATTTLYAGGMIETASSDIDIFEARTGYTITCSGLPSGYQVQANGSATYKASESSGTATLDVGMLEWPLTSVEVLDGSNNQVEQLLNITLTDMGGGDAFAYSAASTKPIWLFKTQYIPQLGGAIRG